MTHPTPSQQTTLLTHIWNHSTRLPLYGGKVFRYGEQDVYIVIENGDNVVIQTTSGKQTLPQAGVHGVTNFVSMKRVPRAHVREVVANVRSAVDYYAVLA